MIGLFSSLTLLLLLTAAPPQDNPGRQLLGVCSGVDGPLTLHARAQRGAGSAPMQQWTLTLVTLLYLGAIPISYHHFQQKLQEPAPQASADAEAVPLSGESRPIGELPAGETKH